MPAPPPLRQRHDGRGRGYRGGHGGPGHRRSGSTGEAQTRREGTHHAGAPSRGVTSSPVTSAPARSSGRPLLLVCVCFRRFNKARFGSNKTSPSGKMATPARVAESPPAADPALAARAAEGAECPPPRQPQPPQNVLAAPRLRAPSSRGLGAAEFGGAAGDVEAPGETFAQRVSLSPAESPPGSLASGSLGAAFPPHPLPGR